MVAGGPPVRPLDRFYTRLNRHGLVEIGPRYSVNSELHRFSPRYPGQPLDGIGQYLYPRASRPRSPDARPHAQAPRPPLPKILQPGPSARASDGTADDAVTPAEAGITVVDWLDERTVAVARHPLADVPQGPARDQLGLHAGVGHAVRLPQPGRDRRVPGHVLPPDADGGAYESIRYITDNVFLGQFVRGMHKWGASVMIILIFLHMARVFFYGAYKYPRELTWVIGVVLLILTLAMGFTGYLLPFDQRSYWATIVGVNINGTGPFIGPVPVGLPARRPRVRRHHAVALLRDPHAARSRALMAALIGAHLYLVTKLGISAPPWLKAETSPRAAGDRGLSEGSA